MVTRLRLAYPAQMLLIFKMSLKKKGLCRCIFFTSILQNQLIRVTVLSGSFHFSSSCRQNPLVRFLSSKATARKGLLNLQPICQHGRGHVNVCIFKPLNTAMVSFSECKGCKGKYCEGFGNLRDLFTNKLKTIAQLFLAGNCRIQMIKAALFSDQC